MCTVCVIQASYLWEQVYNFVSTLDRAKKKGVKIVRDIFEEQDEFGKVRYAIVQTYGETTHTFIERNNYKGLFLPGYKPARMKGEFCKGVIP